MRTVDYLKEVYGYDVPIFLKNIRIGGKSKTSIRKELSRAVDKGEIERESNGIYYFSEEKEFGSGLSFEDVVELKFIKNDYGLKGLNLDIYGYYTGMTFLHMIGLTQQVPAVLEIATNNTSCKRLFKCHGFRAILRKGKIKIDRFNYKALQFFDLFYLLDVQEIKDNRTLLIKYMNDNDISKADFEKYISLYQFSVYKKIVKGGLLNAFR